MPVTDITYNPGKQVRAMDYSKGGYITQSGFMKADLTNYPNGYPRGLVLAKKNAGADQNFYVPYDSAGADGAEIPVAILSEGVSEREMTELKDNRNGVDCIRVEFDIRGVFHKDTLTGWDANALSVMGARELGNLVYID